MTSHVRLALSTLPTALLPTTAKRIRQLVTSITFLTSVTAFLQMPIKARQVKRVQITVKSSFLEMWKNPGARFNEKKCFDNKDLGEGVRQTQNRGSKCHKCAMIFLLWITSRSLLLWSFRLCILIIIDVKAKLFYHIYFYYFIIKI